MGSMTFTRLVAANAPPQSTVFDSEPKRSLCLRYGWSQDTFQLRQTDSTELVNVYDVYAASTAQGTPVKQGTLRQKTRDAIWAAMK